MSEEKNNQEELNDREMENAAGGRIVTPRKKTISCFYCDAKFQVNEGEKGFAQCPNCGKTVDACRTYR